MALVLDVSAVAGMAFADEDPFYAQAITRHISSTIAFVPTLFWFELRNGLIMGERRKRITPAQTATFIAELAALSIEVDYEPQETVLLALARHYNLTVYDAAYLELAQRRRCPLATQDAALLRAAAAAGVAVWAAG